ncbi:MAG: hypothetical protein L0Y71_08620 [Gemmataceae bacterium]|nr:hypothetical protein [Gemmataceae bacterium]
MYRNLAVAAAILMMVPPNGVLAQSTGPNAPRFGIVVVPDTMKTGPDSAPTKVLKVQSVKERSLGYHVRLKPGDIFESIKVGDRNIPVTSARQITDVANEIRTRTDPSKKGESRKVDVQFTLFRLGAKEPTVIEGSIYRSPVRDPVDGGTFYIFEDKSKRGQERKPPSK